MDPYLTPDLSLGNSLQYAPLTLSDFHLELLFVFLLIVYLLSHSRGSVANKELARKWMRVGLPLWEQQFAHVGDDAGHKLIKDSPRDYIFYATGRRHVLHVYGFLELVARHDPVKLLMDYFQRTRMVDRVKFVATLHPQESDPVVLALFPKSKSTALAKERWDIQNFTKPCIGPNIPRNVFTTLADAPETAEWVWSTPKLRKLLFLFSGLDESGQGTPLSNPILEQLVLSDLPVTKPTDVQDLKQAPKLLTVAFKLPSLVQPPDAIAEQINLMTEFLTELIDTIGMHGRLSSDVSYTKHAHEQAKAKTMRLRVAAEESVLKSKEEDIKEALQRKKIQEKKARDEAAMKLSPEEQRKYEEKERKRDAKKAKAKMMKKGKVSVR